VSTARLSEHLVELLVANLPGAVHVKGVEDSTNVCIRIIKAEGTDSGDELWAPDLAGPILVPLAEQVNDAGR